MITTQDVARYSDGRYTVRTYHVIDGLRHLIREVPADYRSIAQATLQGHVVDVEP